MMDENTDKSILLLREMFNLLSNLEVKGVNNVAILYNVFQRMELLETSIREIGTIKVEKGKEVK